MPLCHSHYEKYSIILIIHFINFSSSLVFRVGVGKFPHTVYLTFDLSQGHMTKFIVFKDLLV